MCWPMGEKMQYIKLTQQVEGKTIAHLNLYILPNDAPEHNNAAFALIENVWVSGDFREQGRATSLIEKAIHIATENNCYKISLMTGSKKSSTHLLYQKCGFSKNEKTAYNYYL